MSHFASTGPETSSSKPSLFLEQPEFDITDAFEFDDLEVEEGSSSISGFTLPSSLSEIKFELKIPKPEISPPIHRRIIELRTGIPFNSSTRKKQKTKVKEMNEKKTKNRIRLSPLSQPFLLNDNTFNQEDSRVLTPLFIPNLEAFTCLNNPFSKPQKWTTHSDQGSTHKTFNKSKLNLSLNSSSFNSTTIETPLFNFEHLYEKSKSLKRRKDHESNQKISNKKHCQSFKSYFNYS